MENNKHIFNQERINKYNDLLVRMAIYKINKTFNKSHEQ